MAKRKNAAQPLPTEVYNDFWIWAEREDMHTYPEPTERCGKWMIYAHTSEVDQVWITIRDAVEAGRLGSEAKVATMKPNRNAIKPDHKVICIYSYDSEDKEDVVRILKGIRELGLPHKAFYKEDQATISGEYSFNTKGPVSKYWADSGETALRIPKGR